MLNKFMKKLPPYIVLIFLLAGCSEGDLFGPKKKPLQGDRLNVLHYDLSKEHSLIQNTIVLSAEEDLLKWDSSDIGQYSDIPENIKLNDKLKQVRSFYINGFNKSSGSSIVINENLVYTYSKNVLSAYDTNLKKFLWSFKAVTSNEKDDIISGSILLQDGVIYLSTGVKDFVAVQASDGKELWRYIASNAVRNIPALEDNKIYIASTDNTLSCLDDEGNLLWRYEAPISSLSSNRIYTPTLFYKDKVLFITTAGDLIILNKYDGSEITQVNLANSSIIGDGSIEKGPLVSPVLVRDDLYILTGEHELIKIDLSMPKIAWQQNIANSKSFWVSGNAIFVVTRVDNQLIALNNHDGKVIWISDLNINPKSVSIEFYGPIVAGNKIYIASRNGELFSFNPNTGKIIDTYRNSVSTHQMPLIVNDNLYFIGYLGSINVWQ